MQSIKQAEDLAHHHIFMWPIGCPYRSALEQWLALNQVTVSMTSIASYATILGCVSSGSGISLLPQALYQQFKYIGGITGYPCEQIPMVQSYFIWNKHSRLHHARDAFIALLKSELNNC